MPKITGAVLDGPYKKDCSILWPILGFPVNGNDHMLEQRILTR